MIDPAEMNERGEWIGCCSLCGTSHDGWHPSTYGGTIRCLRAQSVAAGTVGLTDQIDASMRDFGISPERAAKMAQE